MADDIVVPRWDTMKEANILSHYPMKPYKAEKFGDTTIVRIPKVEMMLHNDIPEGFDDHHTYLLYLLKEGGIDIYKPFGEKDDFETGEMVYIQEKNSNQTLPPRLEAYSDHLQKIKKVEKIAKKKEEMTEGKVEARHIHLLFDRVDELKAEMTGIKGREVERDRQLKSYKAQVHEMFKRQKNISQQLESEVASLKAQPKESSGDLQASDMKTILVLVLLTPLFFGVYNYMLYTVISSFITVDRLAVLMSVVISLSTISSAWLTIIYFLKKRRTEEINI